MGKKNSIVITNVDSLLGYAVSYRFLQDWNREQSQSKGPTEFKLLCKNTEGLEDLTRLGGKIIQVQRYDDIHAMNQIMQGVYYVMFIPEASDSRIQEGQAVLQCAKEQDVDYVAMFSYLGLGAIEKSVVENRNIAKFMHLKQFLCLEQQLNKLFDQSKYCIFRTPLWHQFFFYLGPMMDDENAIQLPIGEHTKWQTIDLADLVDAVYRLSLPGKRDENKTLFEFTLDHNMTSKEIVEAAQKGLDQQIKFKQVDPNVFKDYLKRMHHDNRFKKRPFSGSDRPYTFPLGQYLHHETIETLVEWFELMEQEEIKPTSDLQDAIETRPQSIQDFFKQNRNQFRRLR